jgi:hypothetical protein
MLPEKTESLRSPTFTLRPSVLASSLSMAGRNVFAFTNKGIAATAATKTTTTTIRILAQAFTSLLGAINVRARMNFGAKGSSILRAQDRKHATLQKAATDWTMLFSLWFALVG